MFVFIFKAPIAFSPAKPCAVILSFKSSYCESCMFKSSTSLPSLITSFFKFCLFVLKVDRPTPSFTSIFAISSISTRSSFVRTFKNFSLFSALYPGISSSEYPIPFFNCPCILVNVFSSFAILSFNNESLWLSNRIPSGLLL